MTFGLMTPFSMFRLLCLTVIWTGCSGPSGGVHEDPAPGASSIRTAAGLPLRHGFYVDADTRCEEASGATLALLRADGLGVIRSQCTFTSVEAIGPGLYRVVEQCEATFDGGSDTATAEWEVLSLQSFRRATASGWESRMRFCDQPSLPEPWRSNDISDITGSVAP
jgi:hypothetical protein